MAPQGGTPPSTGIQSTYTHPRFLSITFLHRGESQNFGSGGALGDLPSTASVRKWGSSLWLTTKPAAPEARFLESQFKPLSTQPPLGLSEEVQNPSARSLIHLCACRALCPERLWSLPPSQLPLGEQLVILQVYDAWESGSSGRAGSWCHPVCDPAHWQNETYAQ